MKRFHMADIIPLLPLEPPPRGKSSFYVPCPKCDHGNRRKDKHLNINLIKDVFRCARCGWYGGIFDLYGYYTNTLREDVRSELIRILGVNNNNRRIKPKNSELITQTEPTAVDIPAADINTRHAVYSAMLSLLSLASDHKKNLIERGLSEQVISNNGYRTTPVVGIKTLTQHLQDMGHILNGIPGFFTDSNGQWYLVSMRRGILIPVRDINGRIQGLQVRRDNQSRRKYRWLSSASIGDGANGCGAEGWIHISGPVRERVILIEGPLKADIVYHLTGQTVIAVPGVNSLKHLEPALSELRDLGMKRLMTAFDMDFLKNPHVQNGYENLVNLLGRLRLPFGTYLWNPEYNGLDDYIWECCLSRQLY